MTPNEHQKRVSAAARELAKQGITRPVRLAEAVIAAADHAVPVITGRELIDALKEPEAA